MEKERRQRGMEEKSNTNERFMRKEESMMRTFEMSVQMKSKMEE